MLTTGSTLGIIRDCKRTPTAAPQLSEVPPLQLPQAPPPELAYHVEKCTAATNVVCGDACRGANSGEQAFQWLHNVGYERIEGSPINPEQPPPAATGGNCQSSEAVPHAGSGGAQPLVVEGVPVQDDSEKLEIANAFRRGNLDGLLATCGFQRITGDMIEESRKAVGQDGITVHLPDSRDMAVRGYYRGVFTRDVRPSLH